MVDVEAILYDVNDGVLSRQMISYQYNVFVLRDQVREAYFYNTNDIRNINASLQWYLFDTTDTENSRLIMKRQEAVTFTRSPENTY